MIEFHKSSIFNLQSSIPSLFALFISFILITTAENSAAQTWHTVQWVNDGDTIVLTTRQRVRYIGINAPEIDHEDQKAQPHGYQARSFNQDLVKSGRIRLEFDTERYDRYGRVLAYIFLEDGTFLNARLLQAGWAFYLYRKPNLKYNKILLKAQQDAMELKNGLWRNWKEKEKVYIGNRDSRRFHISSCPLAMKLKSKNKLEFSSKWDAFSKGYAPSKKCIEEFWSYEAGE
jgi:endonuclease YncB( thermonuclease family)